MAINNIMPNARPANGAKAEPLQSDFALALLRLQAR